MPRWTFSHRRNVVGGLAVVTRLAAGRAFGVSSIRITSLVASQAKKESSAAQSPSPRAGWVTALRFLLQDATNNQLRTY